MLFLCSLIIAFLSDELALDGYYNVWDGRNYHIQCMGRKELSCDPTHDNSNFQFATIEVITSRSWFSS